MKRRGFLGSVCAMALAVQVKLDVPKPGRWFVGIDPATKGHDYTLVWYEESGSISGRNWGLINKKGELTHKQVEINLPERKGTARAIGNPRQVTIKSMFKGKVQFPKFPSGV